MNFYILAGGRSKRMRRNKALLIIDDVPVIERVVRVIPTQTGCIKIVTNSPAEYSFLGLPMIGDVHRNVGPIAGIHAGLLDSGSEASFFLACDLPFISTATIEMVCNRYSNQNALAIRIERGPEPLCAIYSRTCLSVIEIQIKKKQVSLHGLLSAVKAEFVELTNARALFNLNTPGDLREITRNE